ncbi:TIGR03767 family metallophosphoesterase [Nocardioides abyssi]|uniref:TIGR03767 family metallophosphoesterase n=1 Tax=Nocardioides abyssi TaxID=3058370 RepID=A0ABT8ER86_9ACTN|nr:TIGR03767 family metallophosphoesterase [Nocardioides abyssi]MDN4160634.1 TIGR03767 family metallophosphoesterase [Nocardioides abyssi]
MPMPDISRRQLLRSAGAAALAATAAASGAVSSAATAASSAATSGSAALGRVVRRGTTLAATIGKGTPNAQGYVELVAGPGEAHKVRKLAGAKAGVKRAKKRKGLLAFAQLSDVHITDAQSPLRVEWVDRWDDEDTQGGPTGQLASSYRAHEMLAAHIADSMVRQINSIGTGPVTGKPLALAVQTGDNSDNSQYNEIRWNIDVLDGAEVRADSGDPEKWEGVHDLDPDHYDIHYWHPDGTPAGAEPDRPHAKWGFPDAPGLLDAARRPFQAEGLKMPWISAFGNHDGLVQGNFLHAIDGLNEFAVGDRKAIVPPEGVTKVEVLGALLARGEAVSRLLKRIAEAPNTRTVTPDEDRRLLSRAEVVAEHFETTSKPVGHGFTEENKAAGTAYYAYTRGKIRFVVLDTVNTVSGGQYGYIDPAQLTWLRATLKQAKKAKKYVVICSHHPLSSFSDKQLAAKLESVLLANPVVIAWVNGHTHTNHVWAHPKTTVKGKNKGRGYWEINTASHIDWPQQSRLIEVADNKDGTLSIFTTMVDHGGPVSPSSDLADTHALASLGRELAANDWHEKAEDRRGKLMDRNVELLLKNPLR